MTASDAVLEHIETSQRKQITLVELHSAIALGHVFIDEPRASASVHDPDLSEVLTAQGVSAAQSKQMNEKLQWLDALERAGVEPNPNNARARATHALLRQGALADATAFSLRTLQKAKKLLDLSGGDAVALLPRFDLRGGVGKPRTDDAAEAILNQVVDLARASPFVKPSTEVYQEVYAAVRAEGVRRGIEIKPPSPSTVRRRLELAISRYERDKKLLGAREANRKYRNSYPRKQPDRPYLEVQIDDTDTGVFLIDDHTGLPSGRAILTVGIDAYDLVPHGLVVGPDPRSAQSAVDCILDGLLPKDPRRPEYVDFATGWIGYGRAANYVMDNPPQNHAEQLLALQVKLNAPMSWAKPYAPTEKTCVEHFNDIVKAKCLPRLPGWSSGEVRDDSVKNGMRQAILTVSQFKRHLTQWIVEVYLNEPGIDGLTPLQRRAQSLNPSPVVMSLSHADLQILRMIPRKARFRDSGGLLLLQLRYNSDQLEKLRRRIGKNASVNVFLDPDDVGRIAVEDPHTKAMLFVPCLEEERYTSFLSVRQQRQILKMARERGIKNPSLDELVKARHQLSQLVDEMRRDARLRVRQKAQRIDVQAMPTPTSTHTSSNAAVPTQSVEVLMTDAEHLLAQLEEIDISDLEWGGE